MSAQPGDFASARFIEQADVLKGGARAATLTRTSSGVEFRYLDEWLSSGEAAVASTLPLTDTPVVRPGGAVPAYFAGLLPEGRRLAAVRRAVKTSADDELSLVLAVGSDAIGDVQVVPAGDKPMPVAPDVVLGSDEELRFADVLSATGILPSRSALPGVQDKASASMLNIPVARAGERFLLKLDPPEYRHLVANEAFFLEAARVTGLRVVDSEVLTDSVGAKGLLVRRFDRISRSDGVHALAVEDGCQAADRPPADKYRLGVERTFEALVNLCDARAVAGRDLISQLAFAYLTGNGDAHAKNFSVLQGADGERRVSPAYDLPSSYPYGDKTMALSMGGRIGADYGLSDFVDLGQRLGVPERAVRRTLQVVVDRCELWSDRLDVLPYDPGVVGKLLRVVSYRRRRLAG